MVKETKLYDLLGVSSSASDAEIKKGYRKMALKYHPDKPTGDTEKFKEISEAFDILSDSNKREVYDQYGLEAARGNGPVPGSGGNPFGSGTGGFGGFGGSGAHGFSQHDAFNIFNQFSQSGGFGGDDGFSSFGGFGGGSPFSANFGSAGGMPGGFSSQSSRRAEPETVTMSLPVTLEDLFYGNTKKMKLNRKGSSGQREQKIMEIKLKPGWKAGTKINFAGEGDLQSDGQRQTIQFILEEKPHPIFKRDGNDLKMNLPLTFKESLLGFSREIETIDGRRIPLSRSSPVQPNTTTVYPDLGMPISKKPGQRGNLELTYKVDYPLSLSAQQKETINSCF